MILSYEKLKDYRGIVSLVDGSFDPLHSGHLAYFRAARSLGYPLLCNVCPDSDTVKKHPLLLPAMERAEILSHLDILTYVHVSERPTHEILRELRPAFYVKGDDWIDALPKEIGQVCDELGIRIRYTATKTRSSSALLAQFQPDVDAFEALVQSQKPADVPWQPVTPFDFESRKVVEGPHAELIAKTFSPTSVLDTGCGAGHLLRMLRAWHLEHKPRWSLNLEGCDVRTPMAGERRDWAFTKADIAGDVSALANWYDLVISREVWEHLTLRQIRKAVTNLCALSARYVYVTARMNLSPRHILDVQTSDNLDPTHISLPPKDLLRVLFALEGFRARHDIEERLDHQQQGRCLVYERV